jgi:hypothetical protein
MSDDIIIQNGWMVGPWRKAINDFTPETRPILRTLFKNQENPLNIQIETVNKQHITIHNDDVAQKVGMRGGVVAGIQHLDLFAPIMVKAFGQSCFETGSISLYYTYALLDGEEVRAVLQVLPTGAKDVQVEARAETPDGRNVATGTLSLGNPNKKAYLQALEIESSPPEELRILKGIKAGDEMEPFEEVLDPRSLENWLVYLEDKIDWFSKKSPWGPPITPLSRIINFMQVIPSFIPEAVGFFGGTEIHFFNGPVKTGIPYLAKGKIIAVGVTSKTEYYWFDSQLYEKETNKLVAGMRHMTRFMKAGSLLYPEIH